MDIRTKLVFALVAVSLGSMFALGAVAYDTARHLLKASSLRLLESLAEVKEDKLEDVLQGWEDRVSLITSRTQLRMSLREYNSTGDPVHLERIQRILSDARESVKTVDLITVYDAEDQRVVSTSEAEAADLPDLDAPELGSETRDVLFKGIWISDTGRPLVDYVAALVLDDERIGSMHVVMDAKELIDVTTNYTGLGETGETLIVVRSKVTGAAYIVNPVRHGETSPDPLVPRHLNRPAVLASEQQEGLFFEGMVDYREEPVWAATRYLPGPNWGLVVKFDAAEERGPIVQLRQRLIRLGLSLAAFAILLGTVLGLWFARPIHHLAEAADRIRHGDLDARATEISHDEIGFLARTFNEMADELQRRIDDDPTGARAAKSESGDMAPERADE